jgi:CheY-like chemotaxis protein
MLEVASVRESSLGAFDQGLRSSKKHGRHVVGDIMRRMEDGREPEVPPGKAVATPYAEFNNLVLSFLYWRLGTSDSKRMTAWLRDALAITQPAVWRKVAGETSLSTTDLVRIAGRLDMSFARLLVEVGAQAPENLPARVLVTGLPERAWIEKGPRSRHPAGVVAVERAGGWVVLHADDLQPGEQAYLVRNIVTELVPALKVALLEDHLESAEAAREVLQELGAKVYAYSTEQELYKELDARRFDVLALDWYLGDGRTSASVVKWVREQPWGQNMPIIIVTGAAAANGDKAATELGDFAAQQRCLLREKPVRWGWLMAEIKAALGRLPHPSSER